MKTAPCTCGSDKLDIVFIEDHKVYHIICELCDKEWIE